MAEVDFSNALMRPEPDKFPFRRDSYIALNNSMYLYNSSSTRITTSETKNKILDTPSKVSVAYTGQFTASGTEFYLTGTSTVDRVWKISNISFSSGDTYSFIVDIEVSTSHHS